MSFAGSRYWFCPWAFFFSSIWLFYLKQSSFLRVLSRSYLLRLKHILAPPGSRQSPLRCVLHVNNQTLSSPGLPGRHHSTWPLVSSVWRARCPAASFSSSYFSSSAS
ncbi:hypothetical protein LMH87_003273 [Akanthomyces muscarius]|uniref:Uncharacterized protein n=1 Tax=Akanthomyces muscarius TaxID=2231603 RepID=A0A9W8UGW6_AKAMU|nr:hypothetical protein LMH87_003273 [Akanthomyces muscarius]KAJ4144389.1 hypothetical protein LMH87_003273 [Akanthomyces muscarius]